MYRTFWIWVGSRRCSCLVTWFCYQMIAKPGNKTVAPSWPGPYISLFYPIDIKPFSCIIKINLTKSMLFVPLSTPFSLSIGCTASAPMCSGKTGRRSSDRSLTMVLPVSNASFIVVTITPTGPRFTHPLQYTPERRVFVSSDLIIEKCWPRSKYQGQGQVITSHSICGM